MRNESRKISRVPEPTIIYALISSVATLATDQISKFVVVRVLNLEELGRMDVLPPFLNFRMGWNTGINFGFFANNSELVRWGLVSVAVLVAIFFIGWAAQPNRKKIECVLAGLLAGGALGNAVDRVVRVRSRIF